MHIYAVQHTSPASRHFPFDCLWRRNRVRRGLAYRLAAAAGSCSADWCTPAQRWAWAWSPHHQLSAFRCVSGHASSDRGVGVGVRCECAMGNTVSAWLLPLIQENRCLIRGWTHTPGEIPRTQVKKDTHAHTETLKHINTNTYVHTHTHGAV